jgi:hypothetical protein
MKKLKLLFYIILFTIIFTLGCKPYLPQKPFIITYKFPDGPSCQKEWCSYLYTDAKGHDYHFCEDKDKYNIGDTIK